MNFIDTHAHIYTHEFLKTQEDMLARALENNVSHILMPNIDKNSITSMLQLYKSQPNMCLPMLGLHPVDVKADFEEEIEEIFSHYTEEYIGVGEIGIDLHWDKTTLDIQKKAFQKQIEFAIQKNLPISVHVRDAFPETLKILEAYRDSTLKGVIHCFTGTLEQAKKAINLGFYLGIGGVLTFKNSKLDKTIEQIDLKHLLLETDTPYLAPTPHRGKTNEPSYIPLIATKLAEIKGVDLEIVAEQTTANAMELFGLHKKLKR